MIASLSEKYLEDNNIQSIGILLDIGKNILKGLVITELRMKHSL